MQVEAAGEALVLEGFGKRYGHFQATRAISFRVAPGEVVGLCGPNGAGKTTTLRAISGIVRPSQGRISVLGNDVVQAPLQCKRRLAFVPDEPAVFEHLTVLEHLRLVARLYDVPDGEARARALLEEVELGPKRDELAAALSRGMKQKLILACALLHRPGLILLDEPLTGLDPVAIRRTKDRVVQAAREGAAVLLSSHLLSLVEELCHRVVFLRRGELVFDGTCAELKSRFADQAGGLEQAFLRLTGEPTPQASAPA